MASNRIGYLDALRGLAILLVIEGHVRLFGFGIKSYDTMSALMLYSFDLPLFFFISGLLAFRPNMSTKETVNNIVKKFKFLVLPAIFFSVVSNLIKHQSVFNPLFFGFKKYWFTITLFECFLIYYVIQLLIPLRKRSKYIMISQMIIAVAFVGLLSTTGSIGPKLIDTNHLFKYFYFFVFGMLACKYKPGFEIMVHNEWLKTCCIIGFFALLVLLDYQIWPSPVFHLLRDVVMRILGTAMIVVLFASNAAVFEKSGKLARLLVDIGKKSLPIYLLQYFFMPNFKMFPEFLDGTDRFTIHVIAAVYTVLITMTCYAFLKVMEQSKFVRTYVLGQK